MFEKDTQNSIRLEKMLIRIISCKYSYMFLVVMILFYLITGYVVFVNAFLLVIILYLFAGFILKLMRRV
jgi:hypothetical protein